MNKISNVWVFSDNAGQIDEIMGAATELGEKVVCFIAGDDAKRAFCLGSDEVFAIKSDDVSENFAQSIAKKLENESGIVLMTNSKRSKAMAGVLGAKLNAGVVADVSEINLDSSGVECKKMMYGGLAISSEKITSKIAIVLLNSGVFAPAKLDLSVQKEPTQLEFIEPKAPIKRLNRLPKQTSGVDLNKAKRIVAIGRGVLKQEDLAIMRELCDLIGAELGCSRPIAEGEKWLEKERYIGISSVMTKPDIYVSIGISGQIQHMVGVKDANKIIAINKDKNALIFDYADYGIVGDLYKVIPALIAALK